MLVSKSVCTFIVLEAGSDADALGCLVYYYTAQSVGVVSQAELRVVIPPAPSAEAVTASESASW